MKKVYIFDIKNESITRDIKCSSGKGNFLKVQTYFYMNSYELVPTIDFAEIVLINTCNHYSEEYKELVTKLQNKFAGNKIVLFGCSKLENLPVFSSETIIVPAHEPSKIENYFSPVAKKFQEINSIDIDKFTQFSECNKNRFYIEVSRGCANYCSFCPIKKSIGFVKSRPMDEIIKEFEYAISNGFYDINLVSEDCGSYGLDIELTFADLFNKMCSYSGEYMINLNYISPNQLLKNFDNIKHNAHRISRMILGIQSFSDRILKLMNRLYKVSDVLGLIKEIRKANKFVYIENQIIYCYPTETREEFYDYLKFSKYYDENIFNLYSNKDCITQYTDEELISKKEARFRSDLLNLMRKKCNYMNMTWEEDYFPW